MSYADLRARLDTDSEPRPATALPDGSVDSFYAVSGESIDTAADFGRAIAAESVRSFPVDRLARRPGGQAVNMARQLAALGDEPTLYGHLDDPVFDDLPFETRSLGAPGEVRALSFADDEVLLAERSPDLAGWTLDDLEAVGDPEALAAPAVCCGNWASARGLTDAFRTLGDRSLDGGVFVLDPGRLPGVDPDRIRALADALGALESSYDVVVSLNRAELATAVEPLGGDPDADAAEMARRLRREAGVTAAVMHAEDEAVAATRADTHRVANLDVDDAVSHTGAGDRFGAALAHALVREWEWPVALALGNLAAVRYVETGETGGRAALRAALGDRGA